MTPNKRYITQISKDDLREIAAAANMKAGDGIELVPDPSGIIVRIDKEQLKRWIWTFWKNGGLNANANVSETSIDMTQTS